MRVVRLILLVIAVVFVMPATVSATIWLASDGPNSWRSADWSSAHLLPAANETPEAAVYILSARTGGLKGSVSEHSWIVLKEAGSDRYQRWDKAGWGNPIKTDNWAADGRWYSNPPHVVREVHGAEAEAMIPRIRAAIADYPYSRRGDYQIFPGPNSNTFVAHVLRAVPEFHAVLPAAAVGRDYPEDGSLYSYNAETGEMRLSLFGYAGLAAGRDLGLEINFLGLVAGIDPFNWRIKIPAFGDFG